MTPATKGAIEEVRAYWDRKPCDSEQSSAPAGTRAYFDEVRRRKYAAEPHVPGFAQFGRWSGKRVLEIGCGIGTDSVGFALAGADVTCVDLSGRSLALARRHFEVFGLRGRFVEANAEELRNALEPEPFDLVYSYGAIHHTPDPARVFQELRAYCSADTELRVMLYARRSSLVAGLVAKQGRGAFWRAEELVRQYGEAQHGCPVTYCYTGAEVRRLLRGFEVVEMRKAFPRLPRGLDLRLAATSPALHDLLGRAVGWNLLVVARPSAGRAALGRPPSSKLPVPTREGAS